MFTKEQMEIRKKGVGASEVAAVCGVSPWVTPLQIYLQKTGQLDSSAPSLSMNRGTMLEPFIADMYSDVTGFQLVSPKPLQFSQKYPFMFASLDRVANGNRNVQIKASGLALRGWGPAGSDLVPDQYMLQVQHEMCVSGHPITDLAVFFNIADFRIFTIKKNDALIDKLADTVNKFMNNVLNRTPPDPSFAHKTTLDLLKKRYPVTEKFVEIPEDLGLQHINRLQEAKQGIKEFKSAEDEAKAQLLHLMATASTAQCGDWFLTRKSITRKGYVVKEISFTTFSTKKIK